jgi:hypothetical protein
MVGRQGDHQRIAAARLREKRPGCDRRTGVAAQRFKQDVGGYTDFGDLLGNQEAVIVAGDDDRSLQAEAIIAARQKIVHGAVGMVEMALHELEAKGVIDFDQDKKASMVSNLLVVLCGESEVHPVVNTGTLYS